jgi:hypothetical protein
MPYITQELREKIKPHIEKFWNDCPISTPGELNYLITQLLERYRNAHYSYAKFNEIIGIIECAKQEYYRRMIAMYEDAKCEENGDVYHW